MTTAFAWDRSTYRARQAATEYGRIEVPMTCTRCKLPITESDGFHNLGRCFRAMAEDRDRWRRLYEELADPTGMPAAERQFHARLEGSDAREQ